MIFCSDEYLLEVNKEFLKREYLTDVISFDYTKEDKISGDVLVSVDRVKENAKENGVTFLEELKRVMVHGLLHLIGYEDNTVENKAIMTVMGFIPEGEPGGMINRRRKSRNAKGI
jgi:rRNA maturation RNase YbeY